MAAMLEILMRKLGAQNGVTVTAELLQTRYQLKENFKTWRIGKK